MASSIPGELIPCAFVWHDPGITPCCKSRKLPGDIFFRNNKKQPTIAALCSLNHATEVAREFIVGAMRSLTSLHESRVYSPENF